MIGWLAIVGLTAGAASAATVSPELAPPSDERIGTVQTIEGISFQPDTVIERDVEGTVTRAVLPRDLTIWGIDFLADTQVHFDLGTERDRDLLRGGTLARDTVVAGVPLQAGTFVTLQCAQAGCADVPGMITGVRGGTVARGYRAGGVRWAKGTYLLFDAKGLLEGAKLEQGEGGKVNGVSLSSAVGIRLHENGMLARGVLAGDRNVHGFPAKAGHPIAFYEGGELAEATLSRDTTVGGYTLEAGTAVGLYPSGAVRFLRSREYQEIDGIPVGLETFGLEFHESGAPSSVTTGYDFEWRGIQVDGGQEYRVEFWEDGDLKFARLAAPARISGEDFAAGSFVKLGQDGHAEEVAAIDAVDR